MIRAPASYSATIVYDGTFRLAYKQAVRDARITMPAKPRALRSSIAAHLLQGRSDICTVQELLRNAGLGANLNYTHVLTMGGGAVPSPLDALTSVEPLQSGRW